jgi:uncharacterized protein (PEP-CTERM system associated)
MGMDMRNSPICLTSIIYSIIVSIASSAAFAQNVIPGSAISGRTTSDSANIQTSQNLGFSNSEAQSSRAIIIRPRISLTETWSDNIYISGAQNLKESGFITQLSPGIRAEAKTARFKAYFDYALNGQYYSTGNNRSQNSLNTFGTLEAVSNWLFLDFSGLISQQAISAFGTQSTSNTNINSNSTETSTYRVSPYIRGKLAELVDYSLRYNWSTTMSSSAAISDIELSEWAGQLRGSTPFQNLKWSVDATQQTADYSQGRTTDAERLYGMATYTIIPQLRASLSAGRESNNYASQNMESHPTHGYGFDWTPTERTQVSAFKERRFFGNGHRYSFSHRFPLSNIRYSDTKDVSVLPNQFTSVGFGTIYSLYYPISYQECQDPNILSQYQDQDTCAIDRLINKLIKNNIQPNLQATSSFLISRATIQRIQQLALAIQGVRNTLTILFNRNESNSIFAATGFDDFNINNVNSISQRGVSINLSHQLSAVSNANLLVSHQKSIGSGVSHLETTTAMYQVNLTSKIGPNTTGGVSIRHTEFDSIVNPYTENALIGTFSVVF